MISTRTAPVCDHVPRNMPRKKATAKGAKANALQGGKPAPKKEFIERWGYELAVNVEPQAGIDYKPKKLEDLPEDERDEEEARRNTFRQDLRVKIGNWARHHWHRSRGGANNEYIDETIEALLDNSATHPRKQKKVSCYQKLYYDSRIKGPFDNYWETVKEKVGEDGCLAERNKYVEQKWHEETEDVKQLVKEKVEQEYKVKTKAWQNRKNWSDDAVSLEEYIFAWIRSDETLGPLADAVSKVHGAGCSIFLWGPRADGNIATTGYHSFPGFESRKDLHEYDLPSYSTFINMLFKFAKTVFTAEYCKSRMVNVDKEENRETDDDMDEDTPITDIGNVGDGAEKENAGRGPEVTSSAGNKPSAQEALDAGDKVVTPVDAQVPISSPTSLVAPSSSNLNVENFDRHPHNSGPPLPSGSHPPAYNDPLNAIHFGFGEDKTMAGLNNGSQQASWNFNNGDAFQLSGSNPNNNFSTFFDNNNVFGLNLGGGYTQPGPAMFNFNNLQEGATGNTGAHSLVPQKVSITLILDVGTIGPASFQNTGFNIGHLPNANTFQLITPGAEPNTTAGVVPAPTQLPVTTLALGANVAPDSAHPKDDMVAIPETNGRSHMASMTPQAEPDIMKPDIIKPVAEGKENLLKGKKKAGRGGKRGATQVQDNIDDQGNVGAEGDTAPTGVCRTRRGNKVPQANGEAEGDEAPAGLHRARCENKAPSRVPTTVAVPINNTQKKRKTAT
ncbi:hypothetical protein PQX77_002495 [Marasmius sp. AFHP31]|nr:hypothetical protein PQX77_002495 [Marasmius sp. AFHP31]